MKSKEPETNETVKIAGVSINLDHNSETA